MATTARFGAASRRISELCGGPIDDDRELRGALLDAIRPAVPFDAYAWLLTDPETAVGASPLAEVPFLAELPRAIRLKYLTAVNRWTGMEQPAALLSETTRGDLAQSVMWRELLHRYGIVDAASAVFRDRFGYWGFLELWRGGPGGPGGPSGLFGVEESRFLASVAEPITRGLRRCQARTFLSAATSPPGHDAGPIVLLLSPELEVRAQTAQVESYLRALVPPGRDGAPVPAGAYNVGAQLLATEAGIDEHPPLARVHLGAGAWLTMKAARMHTAASGDEPDIAVSIELASAQERASLFARAFALTPREVELLHHLSGGGDTRALARSMQLSEHTVQDHLKSIFAKTGLRSRSALRSAVTGR